MNDVVVPGFGERFLELFAGLSQTQIARLLGVSKPAITNYVQDRVPKLQLLFKILELRPCSLDWLLKGENPKNSVLPFQSKQTREALESFSKEISQADLEDIQSELNEEDQHFKAKLWFSEWAENYFGFDERERKVIQDIAEAGGISFNETIVHLVREALALKGFGEMPGWIPVPVFETMPEDIERQVFQHLDNLPESTRMAETKKLIGALVTRAATP